MPLAKIPEVVDVQTLFAEAEQLSLFLQPLERSKNRKTCQKFCIIFFKL